MPEFFEIQAHFSMALIIFTFFFLSAVAKARVREKSKAKENEPNENHATQSLLWSISFFFVRVIYYPVVKRLKFPGSSFRWMIFERLLLVHTNSLTCVASWRNRKWETNLSGIILDNHTLNITWAFQLETLFFRVSRANARTHFRCENDISH